MFILQKYIFSFQSYSENMLQVNKCVNVNDIMYTREKEESGAYYQAAVFQVLYEYWIKVKWDQGGFLSGIMSNVHVSCIKDNYALYRAVPRYRKEMEAINTESEDWVPGTSRNMPYWGYLGIWRCTSKLWICSYIY